MMSMAVPPSFVPLFGDMLVMVGGAEFGERDVFDDRAVHVLEADRDADAGQRGEGIRCWLVALDELDDASDCAVAVVRRHSLERAVVGGDEPRLLPLRHLEDTVTSFEAWVGTGVQRLSDDSRNAPSDRRESCGLTPAQRRKNPCEAEL